MQRKYAVLLFAALAASFVLFGAGFTLGRGGRGAVASVGEPIVRQTPETGGLLDVNTATAEELETLPGIGEKLAAAIVSYREENGPFESVWMLESVSGIGKGKLEAIAPYVCVS